jgi:hypothetical protein
MIPFAFPWQARRGLKAGAGSLSALKRTMLISESTTFWR